MESASRGDGPRRGGPQAGNVHGERDGASRLLLGLGCMVDLEVRWDADALSVVARELHIRSEDLDASRPILDERDLAVVLLALFAEGRGDERFVASSQVVRAFANRFRTRTTLGGTAVRAALAMDVLGVSSTVHVVDVDATVRRLLPPACVLLYSGESAHLDPHLIVQYPLAAVVRLADGTSLISPQPNRVIFANDPPNRLLPLARGLPDAVARAEIIVLSTLNAIQDPAVLAERLAELEAVLEARSAQATVLWEDAAYHLPALHARAGTVMARLVDIYSMNEEELQAWIGRPVDLLDAGDVARSLDELVTVLPAPSLVVHTRYWALALGVQADCLRKALRGGITMASARYARGDALDRAVYESMETAPLHENAARVAGELESRRPGIVCEPCYDLEVAEPTTIGLGDAFIGGFTAALAEVRFTSSG